MRNIYIDLSSDNYLQRPKIFGGYAGEHNETVLQVKLPTRMIDIECSGYRFDFQTSEDNLISSPLIPTSELENDVLSFRLTQQVTIVGNLMFKVVAVLSDENGVSLISKSNTVVLCIQESPSGKAQLFDPNGSKDELQRMIDERILELNPAEVDQEYDAESERAQSGVAVAQAVNEAVKNFSSYDEIKLDAPAVTDYIKGEEAYLYPSMMVRTTDSDWYKKYDFYQWGQYTITNKPKGMLQLNKQIIDINTSTIPEKPKNVFTLKDRHDASNKIESISAVYVHKPLTDPNEPKNVLIVGDSISAYTPSWVNQIYNNHFKKFPNYRLIGRKAFLEDEPVVEQLDTSVATNILSYLVNDDGTTDVSYTALTSSDISFELTDTQSVKLKPTNTWNVSTTPYLLIPIDNSKIELSNKDDVTNKNWDNLTKYDFKLEAISNCDAISVQLVFTDENGSKMMTSASGVENDTGVINTYATDTYNKVICFTQKPTHLKITLPKELKNTSSVYNKDVEFKVSLIPQVETVKTGFEATGGYTWDNYTSHPASLPDDAGYKDNWKNNPFWNIDNHNNFLSIISQDITTQNGVSCEVSDTNKLKISSDSNIEDLTDFTVGLEFTKDANGNDMTFNTDKTYYLTLQPTSGDIPKNFRVSLLDANDSEIGSTYSEKTPRAQANQLKFNLSSIETLPTKLKVEVADNSKAINVELKLACTDEILINSTDIRTYIQENVDTSATLDYVVCILGMNSYVNHAYFTDVYGNDVDAALNSIRELCTHFIDTVLSESAYPNCKILLGSYCMPPFIDGVNNAYWNNLFERAEFIHRLNELYQDIVLQYPNNVRFTHVTSQVDSQYAYPMGTKIINGAEYPFIDDSIQVHVNDIGHYQISEAMWRGFTGLVNMA